MRRTGSGMSKWVSAELRRSVRSAELLHPGLEALRRRGSCRAGSASSAATAAATASAFAAAVAAAPDPLPLAASGTIARAVSAIAVSIRYSSSQPQA